MIMLIKIPFIQYLYGIRSMRQTVKEIEVNVAYRWFLGLEMMDKVPHFSTFGFWSADPKRFVYSLKLPHLWKLQTVDKVSHYCAGFFFAKYQNVQCLCGFFGTFLV